MKPWTRLCFLVLAFSLLCRGQTETTVSSDLTKLAGDGPHLTSANDIKHEPTLPTPWPPSAAQNQSTANATSWPPTASKEKTLKTIEEVNGSTVALTTASGAAPGSETEGDKVDAPVSTATTATSAKPALTDEQDQSSWGYVILVFMILMIIALSVILYLLRRAARTYSFDLQRPTPVDHLNEPTGTFEQVYLDDLARPAPDDDQVTRDDLSPPPVANGTTLQPEEKGSNGENAPQAQPEPNGVESSLSGTTSPSPGDDPADRTSGPLSSTDMLLDAIGDEQQNENNNNPSVCSSDPFVEINLDDPAWCDQLLTSPAAPSSVLPFSPFSFSSSSTSSSS
uniref:uncharacterized protein LOC124054735 n=1 Tax=Scatophagus argus TaxID=75038 RepID=UPI001ED7D76E|nr:uncharacterized protein LOC124054735 [Scatophagus argus]